MDPNLRAELEKLEQSEAHSAWHAIKGWWDRHGTQVLLVLLALALVFAAKNYLDARASRLREEKYRALDQTTSPDAAFHAAEEHSDDPLFQARAYLRGADLALGRARMPVGNQVNELPAEVHDDMLKSAEQGYQDVVKLTTGTKTPGLDPVYELNARLGLASVAEDRSQWDQARRGYTDIAAAADQAHLPLIGALARALLARIDARTQPVILDTTTTINVPLPGAATTAPAPGTQPAFDLGPLTPTTQRSR